MSEYLPGLLWLVVLLAGNAFFVGAEFAVISARRSQIEPKAAAGSRAAKTTLYAMEHATLMLATSQLGITVCSLLILTVSEPAIHHLLEYPLGATPLSPDMIGVVAFVVALVLVTYLHVVFGEMVPKNTAFSVPDRAALHARAPAGAGLPGLPAGHRHPELDGQRRRPPVRGRAQGRGHQHLHPRGGRRHRRAVPARGNPVRHRGHPGRRLRVHRQAGRRRGRAHRPDGAAAPRGDPAPGPPGRQPARLLPLRHPGQERRRRAATCTSRT